MANKNNNSNSECKNFCVLGDSLSDDGAIIEILNNLSFVRNVKLNALFIKEDLLAMALLLLNM